MDAEHVARFNFEIAAAESRPMFFFDSDGSRAGAFWYVRRVAVDRVDPQLARREAEDLGLSDKTAWLAATDYLAKLDAAQANPGPVQSSAAAPSEASAPSEATSKPAANRSAAADVGQPDRAPATLEAFAAQAGAAAADPSRSPAASTSSSASDRTADGAKPSQAAAVPIRESLAWRPLAALILTGLTVPLAYWTRTAVPAILSKVRASLPAPALPRRSLPRGSGE